jgi:hypothetical protein
MVGVTAAYLERVDGASTVNTPNRASDSPAPLAGVIRAVLWIRIRSDPNLLAAYGSGENHFGSGSGQTDLEVKYRYPKMIKFKISK